MRFIKMKREKSKVQISIFFKRGHMASMPLPGITLAQFISLWTTQGVSQFPPNSCRVYRVGESRVRSWWVNRIKINGDFCPLRLELPVKKHREKEVNPT